MANFDLTQALVAVDLTDPNFVNFNSFVSGTPNFWDWLSGAGHRLDLIGGGLTYGPGGHALTGTISAIGFDLGNNSASATELAITGLNIAAATLDDSPDSFWRILDGSDTIVGPLAATVAPGSVSKIFGDGINARAGATGGNDTIDAGDTQISVYGDVYNVGIQLLGARGIVYNGGNDVIEGRASTLRTTFSGDAEYVYASGRLFGGDDTIVIRSSDSNPTAFGDVAVVEGIAGDVAELFGGDDTFYAVQIVATTDYGASMFGDVGNQGQYSYVICGNDNMYGSNGKDSITGDVGVNSGNVVGGDDLMYGYSGDDNLIGEVFNASGTINGGDDTMFGGDGADRMFGEYANGSGIILIGGNDKMYGESGADFMRGQGGNDLLDGGFGVDEMEGGIGNDRYYVDDILDIVTELASEGSDFIYSSVTRTMSANTERLYLTGIDNINGTGINGQADVLTGNSGNNILNGLTGSDTMAGGAGDDTYLVDNVGDNITETAGQGTLDRVRASISFTLGAGDEIEVLQTSNSAAVIAINLTGNALAQTIYGNAGVNTLNGGVDALKDTLVGAAGDDTYIINSVLDNIIEAAGGGTADRVRANVSFVLAADDDIEIMATDNPGLTTAINLTGNALAQTIYGNAGANILNGGIDALKDTLVCAAGNDTYVVNSALDNIIETAGNGTADRAQITVTYVLGAGDNIEFLETTNAAGVTIINLTGNELAQTINGNAAVNILNGGLGNDTLTGRGAGDFFLFNTALNAATNHDTITDFNVINDTIQLENAIFTLLTTTGTLAANLFEANSIAGQNGSEIVIYNKATGDLYYDTNGAGTAGGLVLFADVTNNTALTFADFVVV